MARGLCAADYEKFKRLLHVFEENYRVTRLYADYLNFCPEAIQANAVETLCADGTFTRHEAVGALLGCVLGLDTENCRADRALYRDYILPSVRILRADDYLCDPYRMALQNICAMDGSWEISEQIYPAFRGAICTDMQMDATFRERAGIGFFPEAFPFLRVSEGSNEWMTLTPVDTDTCREAIEEARGDVVTFGLGLGYYAFHVARKCEVRSVTVVERDETLIRMFCDRLLPCFPDKEKIRICHADAFAFANSVMPQKHYDIAFVDTWRDASDGLPMYLRMKRLESKNPHVRFLYWIEGFLLSRLRAHVLENLRVQQEAATHGTFGSCTFSELAGALSDSALREQAKTYEL